MFFFLYRSASPVYPVRRKSGTQDSYLRHSSDEELSESEDNLRMAVDNRDDRRRKQSATQMIRRVDRILDRSLARKVPRRHSQYRNEVDLDLSEIRPEVRVNRKVQMSSSERANYPRKYDDNIRSVRKKSIRKYSVSNNRRTPKSSYELHSSGLGTYMNEGYESDSYV